MRTSTAVLCLVAAWLVLLQAAVAVRTAYALGDAVLVRDDCNLSQKLNSTCAGDLLKNGCKELSTVQGQPCCNLWRDFISCSKPIVTGCETFETLLSNFEDTYNQRCNGGDSSSGSGDSGNSASDSGSCFPADATVELADGSRVRMDALRVGTPVRVAGGALSDVFAFGHRDGGALRDFVRVEAGGAALELSPTHYLPVNSQLTLAGAVKVGDTVLLGRGGAQVVSAVSIVRKRGLYNPHTLEGSIVVDNVLASTYTQACDPRVAHLLLAIPRLLYRLGVAEPLGRLLYKSQPAAARLLVPSGPATF